MKPNLVSRALLLVCAIAAVGLSLRELKPVLRTPTVVAAMNGAHRSRAELRAVALHRDEAARAAGTVPAAAPAVASAPNMASAPSVANATNAASLAISTSTPTPVKTTGTVKSASTARAKLRALRTPLSLESANNPFAASSWLPPPPPVVVAPAPPEPVAPPTAPPVPFTYLGELDAKAAKPQVFLSNGDRLLIVSPGEVIDAQYRIESVSESDVVLTYLPLNERQVLSTQAKDKK
ncbi:MULTISPECIES: hypothetical protein [Paraburkholderia]|uniref:Secretion system X translation initiation factor n=1 Tax=Paraburkholderia podalyriae TaxID=1938811 RepID=A0ABR7PQZ7_9BURK|nr:hypothetical protein [Paraburkholderia podalyriae]MBC8748712.1 hypothetical protein [Paraburkholderia podalyriae]